MVTMMNAMVAITTVVVVVLMAKKGEEEEVAGVVATAVAVAVGVAVAVILILSTLLTVLRSMVATEEAATVVVAAALTVTAIANMVKEERKMVGMATIRCTFAATTMALEAGSLRECSERIEGLSLKRTNSERPKGVVVAVQEGVDDVKEEQLAAAVTSWMV